MSAAALGAGAFAAAALVAALPAEAPPADAFVFGVFAGCALSAGALGVTALVAPESPAPDLALVFPVAFGATRPALAMLAPAPLPALGAAGDWAVAFGGFERAEAARFVPSEAAWARAATVLVAAAVAVPTFGPTDLGVAPLPDLVALRSGALLSFGFAALLVAWRTGS